MAVPGIERELFRELPAALPGEPRITTEVLLQVSSNTSPRTLSQIDAHMFKCISGNTFCCFFRHCLNIFLVNSHEATWFPSPLGMRWSAATTTSHSSSHWCQAWSSFALIWSWLAYISSQYQYKCSALKWVSNMSLTFLLCLACSGCTLPGRCPIHARILQTPEPAGLWGKAAKLWQHVPAFLHLPHLYQPGVGWQCHSPLKWR